jgi:hypothetical protein
MISTFFSFSIVILVNYAIGRRLLPENYSSAIFISLLIIAAIISPLAYINVYIIKYVLYSWLILGLIFWVIDYKIIINDLIKNNYIIYFFKFTFLFLFFLFYFRGLSSLNYVFESHDLVYFSWVNDFLCADYHGPLRSSVVWPKLMTSNHLLPGSFLSALSTIIIYPNLITTIDIRYYFLSFYFATFIIFWSQQRNVLIVKLLVLFVGILSIYGQEIGYELRISSFLYIVILLELLKGIIFLKNNTNITAFSYLLILAKGPILFIAIGLSIWYSIKPIKLIFTKLNVFILLIIFINIFTWIIVPPPQYPLNFEFASPINAVLPLNAVKSWFIPDFGYELIVKNITGKYLTLFLVFYIVFKYYIIFFLTSPYLKGDKNVRYKSNSQLVGLELYVLISLSGFIFIRHAGSIGHVAHAYLLMAILTSFCIIDNLINYPSKTKYIIFILLSIIYGNTTTFIDPFKYTNSETMKSISAIKKHQLGKFKIDGKFYIPETGESPAISQMKASMLGLRLDSFLTPSPAGSQIGPFLRIESK